MSTRAYEFVVGPETSTTPSVSDPSASTDTINKGWGDKNYHRSIDTVNNVKAVGSSDRQDAMVIWVDALASFFYFDSASSAAGDDTTVIQPTSGTGRWLKVTTSSGTDALATKTGAYTLTSSDKYILANATSAFTLTLPAAASHQGRTYIIKHIGTDGVAVTIDANGSETIDGELTLILDTQYASVTIVSDGTNWYIV